MYTIVFFFCDSILHYLYHIISYHIMNIVVYYTVLYVILLYHILHVSNREMYSIVLCDYSIWYPIMLP